MQTLFLTRGADPELHYMGEQPILLLLQKLHEICSIVSHENNYNCCHCTRCQILRIKCIKFDFSAPDPAGELTALPQGPDPLAGGKGLAAPFSNTTPLTAFRASIIYTKFVQLILTKIIIIDVTRCQILRLIAPNSIAAGALPQIPLGSLQLSQTP